MTRSERRLEILAGVIALGLLFGGVFLRLVGAPARQAPPVPAAVHAHE